jgi:hypothetical protein
MEIHSLGRAFTNFSRQPLKVLNFSYGVSIGNLSKKYKTACGERAALMIRLAASEPFEYVAISFVAARTTVVENCCKTSRTDVRVIHTTVQLKRNKILTNVTSRTNQLTLPVMLVSTFTLLTAMRSPMSYGRRTKIKRRPSKYLEQALEKPKCKKAFDSMIRMIQT